MIIEKRKIPGISYAFTRDGIELPVLDITHPLFTSSIDEEKLKKMIPEIAPEARKRAESFRNMPMFIKRFLAKRSYIMAGMMEMTTGKEYLSGLSTMMMKLGPGLIGKGRRKFLTPPPIPKLTPFFMVSISTSACGWPAPRRVGKLWFDAEPPGAVWDRIPPLWKSGS